ncbi:MAG: hypothetical protein JKY49_07285 [Cohaesibacteraceae bacterium]|nr:hypothetical protein [Cohaesibacteraceae bacterium]MBL4874990.1 hypothetical protein [Cohaesibacteraceae bacterium]
MIFDTQNMFSNQQVLTASTGSTDVIDLGTTGIPYGNAEAIRREKGGGKKMPLLMQVTEDFNNLTSLEIKVQTSDDSAFGSGVLTHATSGAIPLANLKAGYQFNPDVVPLAQGEGMHRYMRVNYTLVGTAPTVGKITAGITMGNQTNG